MPICIIIALDIVITLRFSINCSIVICSPTILFAFKREASSQTCGPPSLFSVVYFLIYKPKVPKISCCNFCTFILFYVLVIFYIYLYQISPLQLTVKGLTTPLSRWVQVFDCLCRYIYWGLVRFPTRLIPWFSNWWKYLSLLWCITLSSSREKPTQAQEVAGRISGAIAREV